MWRIRSPIPKSIEDIFLVSSYILDFEGLVNSESWLEDLSDRVTSGLSWLSYALSASSSFLYSVLILLTIDPIIRSYSILRGIGLISFRLGGSCFTGALTEY